MFEIIAMVTMLIDHIGGAFFPDQPWFRIIGRLAMPLYTYGIVQGYRYTRNFKKYLLRLLLIASTSQVFYTLLFREYRPNIVFTFIVCLLLLKYFIESKDRAFLKYYIVINATIFLQLFQFSYGAYAFILTLIYYYNKRIILNHNLLNIAAYFVNGWTLQLYSFVASILIKYVPNPRLTGHMRTFYTIFYPLHLAVLVLIDRLIH